MKGILMLATPEGAFAGKDSLGFVPRAGWSVKSGLTPKVSED